MLMLDRMAEVSNYHGEAIPQGNFSTYGHYSECFPFISQA
jgi:hypothetical protein